MYTAPRGTADILPDEQAYWRRVRDAAETLAARFGYQPVDTPLFEELGVFERGIGEGTDIVEKEMFVLQPRGEDARRFALRPEATAGLCRAYLERGMSSLPQPVRLAWYGPNFRYERPQAGRLRQFWQVNLEAIGSDHPSLDAEIILYAWRLYEVLGIRNLSVLLNTIGDRETRAPFLERLRDHFRPHLEHLERDDQLRFEKNPLRLLDSKHERTRALLEHAPDLHDALSPTARDHFERVQAYLRAASIPFTIDKRLVRGFDYYSHTVFEVVPPDAGAQGTLGGGGRYDGLIELLGGRATPAVGFATGVERIILNMKANEVVPPALPSPEIFVAVASPELAAAAFALADELRGAGLRVQLGTGGSLKSQLRQAGRLSVRATVITGEEEHAAGEVTLRDMQANAQRRVPRAQLAETLLAERAPTGP